MTCPASNGLEISPLDVYDAIDHIAHHRLIDTQISVCVLSLRNGAKVLGYNYGALDPARQDWGYGKQAAYDMARAKVFELLAYAAREQAQAQAQAPAQPGV